MGLEALTKLTNLALGRNQLAGDRIAIFPPQNSKIMYPLARWQGQTDPEVRLELARSVPPIN